MIESGTFWKILPREHPWDEIHGAVLARTL
jgi:hypothetical protein